MTCRVAIECTAILLLPCLANRVVSLSWQSVSSCREREHVHIVSVASYWSLLEELPESRCGAILLLFSCSVGGVGDLGLERVRSEVR